jgi:DNA helicase-2/ATP-dependent DNA helicase PcrA
VLARIEGSGNAVALRYEIALREEGALDFDDLLRHADRILALDGVARGYPLHFAAVLVDEVQDLSMQQLRMVQRLGGDRITYAGDYGQGIYSFAGADPDRVFAEINALSPAYFQLTRSFRSSPAVLRAVNALGALRGAPALRCAHPTSWGADAIFAMQTFASVEVEGVAVLQHAQRLLTAGGTVGVIARVGSRLAAIRCEADKADLSFTDWSAPLHHVEALRRIREHMATALRAHSGDDDAALDALERMCLQSCAADDVDGRDEVQDACAELRRLVGSGSSLQQALARCRPDQPGEAPVKPGLHLLNAHLGKGQEFDHVVIVGLEEGITPDFRSTTLEALAEELRTLTVMVSRARTSLLVTFSATVPIASGWPRPREPSRWWGTLAGND